MVLLLLAAAPRAAQADILYLRDGSRHYGELIAEERDEITFRIVAAGGASAMQRFARQAVLRVERTPDRTPPAARADAGAAEVLGESDFDQMLREAFELLDDGDRPAALRALQRLVTLAPPETLTALDEPTRARRNQSLPALLAELRLEDALRRVEKGGALRMRGVTRFESAALGGLLAQRTAVLLKKEYDGRTIEEWATGVTEYKEVQPDSRQLVADARLAAALLATRIRHDPELKATPADRARQVELRGSLSRFAAGVMSLRGYTAGARDETESLFRRIGRGGALLRTLPPTTSRPAAPDEGAPAAEQAEEPEP